MAEVCLPAWLAGLALSAAAGVPVAQRWAQARERRSGRRPDRDSDDERD